MSTRPNTPCKHLGYLALVSYRQKYCDKHAPLHAADCETTTARGYGSKWQKASKAFLQAHPLRVKCREDGQFVKGTVVDHIIPHRGDQKYFWDRNNWQPLSKKHHNQKTRREDSKNISLLVFR